MSITPPNGVTPNIPALDYVKMIKQRDYNPRPPRSDAQSGREMMDMNEKTPKKQMLRSSLE